MVKLDGEGCEYYLLDVPNHLIKKTPYWIIDFHRLKKNKKKMLLITRKFAESGFIRVKTFPVMLDCQVLHFKKVI